MRRVFVSYSKPIRFARFDGKSVNRGLPVLDQARALDPCHKSEGSWALGTRMSSAGISCAKLSRCLLLADWMHCLASSNQRRSRKRNRKKWKRSDSSDCDSIELCDSAYDSNFRFLLGRKLSYDSVYDSDYDSVASENQPL